MINNIIDFGKFELFPDSPSTVVKAALDKHNYVYDWGGTFNTKLNRHTKEVFEIKNAILVDGILCDGCNITVVDERCIEKITFALTEFSKINTSTVAKMLNNSLHTQLPELERGNFIKKLPCVCNAPFGQVLIEHDKEEDSINIELYFRGVCSEERTHSIDSAFGPDRLDRGRIYLNQSEVNGFEKISSIMQRLQDNTQEFIYVDKCLDKERQKNKTMPYKEAKEPVIKIDECAWLDEIFSCHIDYSEVDSLVKAVWLYKKTNSFDDAFKIYKKLIEKLDARKDIKEHEERLPAYTARRYKVEKINFFIEVALTDNTLRVAFLYNYGFGM